MKFHYLKLGFISAALAFVPNLYAQEATSSAITNSVNAVAPSPNSSIDDSSSSVSTKTPTSDFVRKAWELSGKNDLEALNKLVDECLRIYGEEAKQQEASLQAFPLRGTEKEYQILNDVATVLFIKAEAYMNNGKSEEAIPQFKNIIENYRWAQAFDPSRGNFWSVAEKSQASIDVMLGTVEEIETAQEPALKTIPPLINPSEEKVIDFRKYGDFVAVGTKDYKYVVKKPKALSTDMGYGIYPNNANIFKSEEYAKVKREGRLEASHWDYMRTADLEAAYFKWLNAPEPSGIRLFYQGLILEKGKMYYEAIKAYHSLIVNFPTTVAWTYWQTPWYPAQAAVSKIKHIIRTHPELNLTTQYMKIEVINGSDNDITNDTVLTWPGVIKYKGNVDKLRDKLKLDQKKIPLTKVKKTIGTGKVRLLQYENGHWQMTVDGKPFVIQGMTYAPTKVGQSPDKGTLKSWMEVDSNANGKLDGPYEAWVDADHDNVQGANEPTLGDFQLMKDMGVNTLREYYQPIKPNRDVLRKMHKEYGFMVILGNFLGKYTLGSGATWFEGTDYTNPVHQQNMMNSVKEMVLEFKDEPYVLMWLLGNENNYGVASNADKKPEAYFKFVNDVAKMIHELDPNHPVAICNGDTLFLDIFAKNAPEVDIFGANVYRGDYGFGSFWEQVKGATDKPAFITEYGAPAYAKHLNKEEAETEQANYHRGNWMDIEANLGGSPDGVGNALGGVAFEWLDEWWKNYEPFYHDRKSEAVGPFAGGYYFEEWFGLNAQGNGKNSPFERQPRKVVEAYKEMWHVRP